MSSQTLPPEAEGPEVDHAASGLACLATLLQF
ncbi:hypothetical protein HNQ59_003303, partial [Chitinivorax tropicus]|nr:hypothetical protein [Chitinivorax tropicus]MBB5019995.1 hypothetical protein [Chitinivorax tropicus]